MAFVGLHDPLRGKLSFHDLAVPPQNELSFGAGPHTFGEPGTGPSSHFEPQLESEKNWTVAAPQVTLPESHSHVHSAGGFTGPTPRLNASVGKSPAQVALPSGLLTSTTGPFQPA